MIRLISFLYNHRSFFLFLILEGIALILVFNYNKAQRYALGDALLEVSLSISKNTGNFSSFFDLRAVNQQLTNENEKLREEILFLQEKFEKQQRLIYNDSLLALQAKSLAADTLYQVIPCKVIQNSTDKFYNYITLDKGTDAGIEKGMGVLSPQGVAGRVIRTTQDYSVALSVLNRGFRLSVETTDQENIGVYEWPGTHTQYGLLKYVPSDILIKPNDTLVTSGYSYAFPPNYLLGIADSIGLQTMEGFYEVRVKLATDFRKLNYVYVIENQQKPLLDSLEQSIMADSE